MAFGIGPLTIAASVVFGMSASGVGVIMASRLPANRFGWIWVAVGLTQGILATLLPIAADHASEGGLAVVAGIVASVGVAQVPFAATALSLLTFPTGTFIDRRWRVLAVGVLVAVAWRGLEVAFGAPMVFLLPTIPNPFVLGPPLGTILQASDSAGIGVALVLVSVSACVASVVVRYRRADLVGKRQIRWFLLGAAALVLTLLPAAYVYEVVGTLEERTSVIFALNFLGFSLLPIATLIAITRYRLYEIDRLINRALVYGSLTAILAGVFTAGIALAQRLFVAATGQTSDAAVVGATLVVATLYAPLRKRLEAFVDRRFKFEQPRFGAYSDELTRLLSATDPRRAAGRLIGEAVRELPTVGGAVLDAHGGVTATAGTWPVEPLIRVSIPGGGGPLRVLAIGPRPDGELHDPRALAALEEIAGLAAAAAASHGSGTPAR